MTRLSGLALLALAVVSLLSTPATVKATTYYFSTSIGNDAYSGTSPSQPWQTINAFYNRLSSRMASGDQVLFCQGDIWWYSYIPSNSNGVTYGSYQCRGGVTAKPIITASVLAPATIWRQSPSNANVLVANLGPNGGYYDSLAVSDSIGIRAVWVGSQRYMPARYPNILSPQTVTYGQTGEFFTATGTTGYTLYCPQLTQPTNYWAGAIVYVRILAYGYQAALVRDSGPGYIDVSVWFNNAVGFYFENAGQYPVAGSSTLLTSVDAPGEWYMDRAAGLLYLYPMTSADKAQLLAGTASANYVYNRAAPGFENGNAVTGVTVNGLAFQWSNHGMTNVYNGQVTITNCFVGYNTGYGIYSPSNRNGVIIRYNTVVDTESDCIQANVPNGYIEYNTISKCGLYAGYGGIQTQNGITSSYGSISYNTITNVGYIGIAPHYGSTVRGNIITNAMMTVNDGGAIYGYGSQMSGVIIADNIVSGVYGNYASWVPTSIAACFYLDYGSSNNYIQNNTCSNAAQCVQTNQGNSNVIIYNNCYAPGIYMNGLGSSSMYVYNLVLSTGTNSQWQNPLVRLYGADYSSLAQTGMLMYSNVYCINVSPTANYLWQLQRSQGTWRYNYFQDWFNAGVGDVSNWESNSAQYYNCDPTKTIFTIRGNDVEGRLIDLDTLQFPDDNSGSQRTTLLAAVLTPVLAVLVVLAVAGSVLAVRRHKARSASATTTDQRFADAAVELSTSSASSSSFYTLHYVPPTATTATVC